MANRIPRSLKYLSNLALLAALLAMAGCGGDGTPPAPPPAQVSLAGAVTFDFVPATASSPDAQGRRSGSLDYSNTAAKPARGIQVEAVGDDGSTLAATQTDAAGRYTLTVPANTSVRLRAKARMLQAPGNGPSWDFAIRDNTSDGYRSAGGVAALYAVDGTPFNSGTANQTQNLHAASGWGGSGYSGARAAAPFAILDQMYDARQKVLAVDGQAVFAPMITYWSPANRPAGGDPAIGNIGTSHWSPGGDRPGLYILGAENVDTDEYDSGVIVHEWGHYFESNFSRADSIGGPHGGGDLLDMRLAFGEGWGNSLAGMVRDDPIYVDTMGPQQSRSGVILDLNQIPAGEPRGWFNESSVQYTLYQMYKTPSLGFGAIYQAMVGPQKTTDAFTSLFSFATYLRGKAPAAGQLAIDQLLSAINTASGPTLDIWGSAQTYPAYLGAGNQSLVLPVYTPLALGQPATVCVTDKFGADGNKFGNFRYLRLNVPQAGSYKVNLASAAGNSGIMAGLYRRGQSVSPVNANTFNLGAGDYVLALSHVSLNACITATLFQ